MPVFRRSRNRAGWALGPIGRSKARTALLRTRRPSIVAKQRGLITDTVGTDKLPPRESGIRCGLLKSLSTDSEKIKQCPLFRLFLAERGGSFKNRRKPRPVRIQSLSDSV